MLTCACQQIDSGDLETLDTLLPPSANERRTLADMIFAKLNEAELENGSVNKITKGMPCIHSSYFCLSPLPTND